MVFIEKAESFFIQLKHCLAISPSPIAKFQGKSTHLFKRSWDTRNRLLSKYGIENSFNAEKKILELKMFMINERIKPNDALRLFELLKSDHWLIDIYVNVPDEVWEEYYMALSELK